MASLQDYARDLMLNTDMSVFIQVLMAFATGILFAPWSYGLLYFLGFLIAYEVIAIYLSRMNPAYWCFRTRVAVLIASIVGFLTGRLIVGYENLLEDRKKLKGKKQR